MVVARHCPVSGRGRGMLTLLLATLLALVYQGCAQPMGEKERAAKDIDLMEDEGMLEKSLLNYLFAKEVVNRLQKDESSDLQRKRSYWKQCAFNAVSCFGK